MEVVRFREDLENKIRACVKSLRSCGVAFLRFDVSVAGASVVAYDSGDNYMTVDSNGLFGFVRGRFSAFADLYIFYFGDRALSEFLNGLA